MNFSYSDETFTVATSGTADGDGYLRGSIGARFSFQFTITSDTSLEGATIWFLPGLFIDAGTPTPTTVPTRGFVLTIPTSPSGDVAVNYVGPNGNRRNFNITTDFSSSTVVGITFEFYAVADENCYIHQTPTSYNIKKALHRALYANTTEFDNSAPSAYNGSKEARLLMYVIPNTSSSPVESPFFDEISVPVKLAFYDKSINDGAPTLQNFQYTLTRGVDTVSELSIYQDTRVNFSFDDFGSPESHSIVDVTIWAFSPNTSTAVALGTFKGAVNASEYQGLPNDAGDTLLDGILKSPSSKYADTGSQFEGYFTIDHDLLDVTKQYYIFMVFEITDNSTSVTFTETYLSSLYKASAPPEPLNVDADWKLDNLSKTFLNEEVAFAAGERIKATHLFDVTDYDFNATYEGEPFEDFVNDFVRVDVSIYVDATNTLLDSGSVINTGTSFTSNKSWLSSVNDTDNGNFNTSLDLRMLYPSDAPTYHDLSGKIRVEFTYVFRVGSGASEVEYQHLFKEYFVCDDYDEKGDIIQNITLLDAITGAPITYICTGGNDILCRVKLKGSVTASLYKLAAILDKEPFGGKIGFDANIQEEEDFEDYINMVSCDPIYDLVSTFDNTTKIASFKIKTSALEEGYQYKVVAIAIKQP